jgi:hypothetical protein
LEAAVAATITVPAELWAEWEIEVDAFDPRSRHAERAAFCAAYDAAGASRRLPLTQPVVAYLLDPEGALSGAVARARDAARRDDRRYWNKVIAQARSLREKLARVNPSYLAKVRTGFARQQQRAVEDAKRKHEVHTRIRGRVRTAMPYIATAAGAATLSPLVGVGVDVGGNLLLDAGHEVERAAIEAYDRKKRGRKNPAVARRQVQKAGQWVTERARLDDRRRHFTAAETRNAQTAVAAVLAGRGKLLGHGNFGSAYRVDLPGGPVLVKMGTRETMHSRGGHGKRRATRGKWSMRDELMHEAGVANELRALGFRVVPHTVYVEHKGWPAVVREYGELVESLTPIEFDALAERLAAVVANGWKVSDDLLLARRRDGSIYVADVGLWSPFTRDTDPKHAYQDLFWLLDKLKMPFMSAAELRYRLDEASRFEANAHEWADEDGPDEMMMRMANRLREKARAAAVERAKYGLSS